MLLKEFIERTGFTPTEECFNMHINPAYMESKLEKDEWCKIWKKSDAFLFLTRNNGVWRI